MQPPHMAAWPRRHDAGYLLRSSCTLYTVSLSVVHCSFLWSTLYWSAVAFLAPFVCMSHRSQHASNLPSHFTCALGMLAVTGPLLVMKGMSLKTATPSAQTHGFQPICHGIQTVMHICT